MYLNPDIIILKGLFVVNLAFQSFTSEYPKIEIMYVSDGIVYFSTYGFDTKNILIVIH